MIRLKIIIDPVENKNNSVENNNDQIEINDDPVENKNDLVKNKIDPVENKNDPIKKNDLVENNNWSGWKKKMIGLKKKKWSCWK